MSKLRPEMGGNPNNYPAMTNGTAYYMIWSAVKEQQGLIHGRLDNVRGEHCAIGSFFSTNRRAALETPLVDEVAAVNDSVPALTPRQRKQYVLRWLRWRLDKAGLSLPGRKPKRQ